MLYQYVLFGVANECNFESGSLKSLLHDLRLACGSRQGAQMRVCSVAHHQRAPFMNRAFFALLSQAEKRRQEDDKQSHERS